jgi:hypothetical protein
MKAWKAFTIAGLAALVSSSALAQEMGGAMGPGADFGYEPGPGPTYYGRTYPKDAFSPGGAAAAGSYARMDKPDNSCAQRHPSYDPRSGTFLTYDGRRVPC